mmetsp:Transcript_20575/g.57358  ORF Transcript_20575/g.57358 Transcript_20575/m.57358 type:complete len:278 (+) Transcript_20575:3127-3960(+)
MVALNSRVWCRWGSRAITSLIWGSKPMSSMRSASSNTMKLMRSRPVLPCCRWSMKRPGVATTISAPALRSCRCSCMDTPPTTMHERTLLALVTLKARTSFSICWASSRVGARTRPMGPSPGRSGGWARQWLIMGMAKDAVLPLPVSAHPRMSLPASAMGMPCVWMGVGVSYLCSLMSWMMFGCRFISMKDSMGGGADLPSGTSTVTFKRCLISSFCSSDSARMRSVGFQSRNTGSTGPRLLPWLPLLYDPERCIPPNPPPPLLLGGGAGLPVPCPRL